jgi:hypothetical protein
MNLRFAVVVALVAATAGLGVVGFLAGQVSGVLAAPAVLAVVIWMHRRFVAPGRWRSKLREKNDLSALWMCQSGAISLIRRLYRRLPSDPRCRFCLGPFGGAGKVLGIRPSRKNPNFCPG